MESHQSQSLLLKRIGTIDLKKVEEKYKVKVGYYWLSMFFFVNTFLCLYLFFDAESGTFVLYDLETGQFLPSSLDAEHQLSLALMAFVSLAALGTRLRAGYCVLCHHFKWPAGSDLKNYCAHCHAHLFSFVLFEGQFRGASDHDHRLIDTFFETVKRGDNDAVHNLLLKGISIEICDKMGHTPLLVAAMKNHPATIQLLLQSGANLKATNNFGLNALMVAAEWGALDAARLLLDKGFDPNEATAEGRTAMELAQRKGNQGMIQLFESRNGGRAAG